MSNDRGQFLSTKESSQSVEGRIKQEENKNEQPIRPRYLSILKIINEYEKKEIVGWSVWIGYIIKALKNACIQEKEYSEFVKIFKSFTKSHLSNESEYDFYIHSPRTYEAEILYQIATHIIPCDSEDELYNLKLYNFLIPGLKNDDSMGDISHDPENIIISRNTIGGEKQIFLLEIQTLVTCAVSTKHFKNYYPPYYRLGEKELNQIQHKNKMAYEKIHCQITLDKGWLSFLTLNKLLIVANVALSSSGMSPDVDIRSRMDWAIEYDKDFRNYLEINHQLKNVKNNLASAEELLTLAYAYFQNYIQELERTNLQEGDAFGLLSVKAGFSTVFIKKELDGCWLKGECMSMAGKNIARFVYEAWPDVTFKFDNPFFEKHAVADNWKRGSKSNLCKMTRPDESKRTGWLASNLQGLWKAYKNKTLSKRKKINSEIDKATLAKSEVKEPDNEQYDSNQLLKNLRESGERLSPDNPMVEKVSLVIQDEQKKLKNHKGFLPVSNAHVRLESNPFRVGKEERDEALKSNEGMLAITRNQLPRLRMLVQTFPNDRENFYQRINALSITDFICRPGWNHIDFRDLVEIFPEHREDFYNKMLRENAVNYLIGGTHSNSIVYLRVLADTFPEHKENILTMTQHPQTSLSLTSHSMTSGITDQKQFQLAPFFASSNGISSTLRATGEDKNISPGLNTHELPAPDSRVKVGQALQNNQRISEVTNGESSRLKTLVKNLSEDKEFLAIRQQSQALHSLLDNKEKEQFPHSESYRSGFFATHPQATNFILDFAACASIGVGLLMMRAVDFITFGASLAVTIPLTIALFGVLGGLASRGLANLIHRPNVAS